MKYAIGVDLGGTKTALGIVDEKGRIHRSIQLITLVREGPEAITNQILDAIQNLQQTSSTPPLGIGVGVAGQIDLSKGEIVFGPNLNWHHVPLQSMLSSPLHLPVYLTNDVKAITYGEWLHGAGQACKDLVCLVVGTGIGSGIVSDGHLLKGCSETLGEVGHMTIDFNGPLCTCGRRGCFEAFAGGWGIAARAREAVEADRHSQASQQLLQLANHQLDSLSAKMIIQAYHQNNSLAERLVDNLYLALTAGCANVVNLFNPCRLILGGGVLEGLPQANERIALGIKQNALKAATQQLKVLSPQLGRDGGMIGAAMLVFQSLKQENLE